MAAMVVCPPGVIWRLDLLGTQCTVLYYCYGFSEKFLLLFVSFLYFSFNIFHEINNTQI